MKRNLRLGTVIILCVLTISVCALSTVSFSQGNDPLVTLSYLTDIIMPQIKKDIMAEIEINNKNLEEVINNNSSDNKQPVTEVPPIETEKTDENELQNLPTGTYTLLELENGKTVFADSVLEFIVRPGSEVKTISPFDNQGIADITNGKEYLNEDIIEYNKRAVAIVKEYGFIVNDLFSTSLTLDESAHNDPVHYNTPAATKAFTEQVVSCIAPALGITENITYQEALYNDKPIGI